MSEQAEAISTKKLLVLLDCCHAGGLGNTSKLGYEAEKAPLPPETQALFNKGKGRVAIASSQADEKSLAGRPYSAFTLVLIEALAGKGASKKDGYLRVADLAMYAREVVPRRTCDRQHPILNFEQADNFILVYYAGGDTEPKRLQFEGEPRLNLNQGHLINRVLITKSARMCSSVEVNTISILVKLMACRLEMVINTKTFPGTPTK